MMSMIKRLKNYKVMANPLQVEYVEYINDKMVPLADRWEAFHVAPYEFRRSEFYVQHFESEKLLPNGEIDFYSDFYVEKYTNVYMYYFIDGIEGELDNYPGWTQEIVDAFKEEILKKNLGSFQYDR